VAPVFIRSLALVRRFVAVFRREPDPVGKFSVLNRNRAESIFCKAIENGEGMSKKEPAGKQDRPVREKVNWKALEIVHPEATGIDVGGSEHWVAINPERDAEPVRRFGCFTADLREMARWLVEKGVRSVAMQSRPQERYSGMPMAVEVARLRPAEQQFSADR
jgi:hypothetical protein